MSCNGKLQEGNVLSYSLEVDFILGLYVERVGLSDMVGVAIIDGLVGFL